MNRANSLALKLGGVTRESKNPAGGTIVRDGGGEPTGILKDAAQGPVWGRYNLRIHMTGCQWAACRKMMRSRWA